jgi:hypothetical protein
MLDIPRTGPPHRTRPARAAWFRVNLGHGKKKTAFNAEAASRVQ